MSSYTRRSFLSSSTAAIAGATFGLRRSAFALPVRSIPLSSRQPVASFFPDLIDPERIRALALAGVDAARQAGATYADIRVANTRTFDLTWNDPNPSPLSTTSLDFTFGVRVRVGGAWGFVFGIAPTIDGVTHAARTIVGTTRGIATLAPPAPQFDALPVVKGEWETPIQIDPFTISPDEHGKVFGAFQDAAGRARTGEISGGMTWSGFSGLGWSYETRVFASSDGALTTQRLYRAFPSLAVRVLGASWGYTTIPVPGLDPTSAGFEAVTGAHIQDRVKAAAEEAALLASYPEGEAEVGRYEAILDGYSAAAVLGSTLAPALEGDRALDYEADGDGTSFLSPIDAVLGGQSFSPQHTVTSDCALPGYGAVKWDDDGVETKPFTAIQHGRVMNYFSTRASMPVLARLYAKQGMPFTPLGTAVAWSPTISPIGCAAQLSITPDASGPTLAAMIGRVKRGVLVRSLSYVRTDQQVAGGSFHPPLLLEIINGRITRRLQNGIAQFGTKRLWNSMTAVGGASTVMANVKVGARGETFATARQCMNAPALHFSQLDIIQPIRRF
jgi:TldD protein